MYKHKHYKINSRVQIDYGYGQEKGKCDGNGQLVKKCGTILDGYWENNKLIGPRREGLPAVAQQWISPMINTMSWNDLER